MRIYTDYSRGDMDVESTLRLEDNGRFSYSEHWTDPAGGFWKGVEGTWRQDGSAIVLRPLEVDESVGGWAVGQERIAFERGHTLDLGGGLKLYVPRDKEEDVPVRNPGTKPLTVVLQPRGTRHTVAPGEEVRIVAHGPYGHGGLRIIRSGDQVLVYGWDGSWVGIVPGRELTEQERAGADAKARTPVAEAPRPAVKPPVVTRAPAPVDERKYPRFEPRTPSPELAALIRRWVDELPTEGMRDMVGRLCKRNDAIPLVSNSIYLWALRADGQVLCVDHESSAQSAEPETNPRLAYAALLQGARRHPELEELVPLGRAGLQECAGCGGKGWTEAKPPEKGTISCHWCYGMGWHAPRAER